MKKVSKSFKMRIKLLSIFPFMYPQSQLNTKKRCRNTSLIIGDAFIKETTFEGSNS